MAHENHDIIDQADTPRKEKELLVPTLGRVVEQAGQRGAKQEQVSRNLRRKLISKFESSKTAVIPKPEAAPVPAEVPMVEIPLGEARQPAEAFIDLRREQVAEELHKAEPQSVAQAEAAADATLLGNTSQQLEHQPDKTPLSEVMQVAQEQTLEALHYPPQPVGESAARPEADAPMSSFVQSYLEKREQTVRAIAHEQFQAEAEPPEFSQAMQLADLLAYSERVFIDGTSLRTMYETGQITEAGLRRITAEQLRGGDVREALGKEHMLNETKFERDPKLRDHLQASYDNVEAAREHEQPPLNDMGPIGAMHTAPKSAADTPIEKSEDTKHERRQAERTFAMAWLTLIGVLIIIAGLLILR